MSPLHQISEFEPCQHDTWTLGCKGCIRRATDRIAELEAENERYFHAATQPDPTQDLKDPKGGEDSSTSGERVEYRVADEKGAVTVPLATAEEAREAIAEAGVVLGPTLGRPRIQSRTVSEWTDVADQPSEVALRAAEGEGSE